MTGGCHCGRVRFEVTGDLSTVLECNCSICAKKGCLHLIVERACFSLLQGEGDLTTYTFGTGVARHLFCRVCGISSFYIPRSHPDCVDVNVRCLDEVDWPAVRVTAFDGRDWEKGKEGLLF